MAATKSRIVVKRDDVCVQVDFLDKNILEETNIQQIGDEVAALVESGTASKLLLCFQNVEHLSSAALGTLITVSANGCGFKNVSFYAGVASALPLGCMLVTGQRNVFDNCHIAGMGNSANDITGAYSLSLAAAAENLFNDCTIGVDTVTLGAAVNSQIVCSAAATRNWFRNCRIMTYTNHATNNCFLRAPSGSLDRELVFEDCQFVNPINSSSTNLTQAMVVVSNGGTVLLIGHNTGVLGATDWNATDSGNVIAMGGTIAAGTYGLAAAVTR